MVRAAHAPEVGSVFRPAEHPTFDVVHYSGWSAATFDSAGGFFLAYLPGTLGPLWYVAAGRIPLEAGPCGHRPSSLPCGARRSRLPLRCSGSPWRGRACAAWLGSPLPLPIPARRRNANSSLRPAACGVLSGLLGSPSGFLLATSWGVACLISVSACGWPAVYLGPPTTSAGDRPSVWRGSASRPDTATRPSPGGSTSTTLIRGTRRWRKP